MFTFKSSLQSNTTTDLLRSEVEVDVQFTASTGRGNGNERQGQGQGLYFRRTTSKPQNININSGGNTSGCAVETVSFKPSLLVGSEEYRESEII
jgi:hypothetical protein